MRERERDSSHEDEDTKRIVSPKAHGTPSFVLVVVSDRGNVTYPLPARGQLTIGRGRGCDVRVDDPRMSRQHATLIIGPERLQLIDVGSANGSRIGDRPLVPNKAVDLSPGDTVVLGSTTAIVQATRQGEPARRVLKHTLFEARLDDECARAATSKVTFAVVRVALGSARNAELAESTFEQFLRPMDVVGSYAPRYLEFLLVDVTEDQARAIMQHARSLWEPRLGPVDIGIAIYPAMGRTPGELLAAAGRLGKMPVEGAATVRSGFLQRTRLLIERVAAGTISVLITGETGVGKEVLAHAIHEASPRAGAPLLCINCAALSETLLESELFGHERGAFTGALQAKRGLIESADGGTVFLDEIGEMPASLQAKLLRVLQEKQVQPVGATKPRQVNVRFLSATNRDLEAEIARGTFRQDLYYRLNGVEIAVPPLRERRDEIEPLARAFVAQCAAQLGASEAALSSEVLQLFHCYAWPGNIRELRNVVEHAVLLCTDGTITLEHVPYERMTRQHQTQRSFSEAPDPLSVTRPPLPMPSASSNDIPTVTGINTIAERARIIAALEMCAGNQTQAAKVLGISRNTLIARLNQFELARPRKRGA